MDKFIPYTGDLMELPTNKNHLNFKWVNKNCDILFSATRQGDGMSCHFATDGKGMEYIHEALNDFVEFIFRNFDWCKMILGKITNEKIKSVALKCGFMWALNTKNYTLYVRSKLWAL